MLDNVQFRELIIRPVLKGMNLWSQKDEELLIGTLAQESHGGDYIIQNVKGKTPSDVLNGRIGALGIFQIEPRTHDDIWKNFLPAYPKFINDIMYICGFSKMPAAGQMVYNLFYATAMARLVYRRHNLETPDTLELQAQYYKTYYNTSMGKADVEEYIKNYNLYVGNKKPKRSNTVDIDDSNTTTT